MSENLLILIMLKGCLIQFHLFMGKIGLPILLYDVENDSIETHQVSGQM